MLCKGTLFPANNAKQSRWLDLKMIKVPVVNAQPYLETIQLCATPEATIASILAGFRRQVGQSSGSYGLRQCSQIDVIRHHSGGSTVDTSPGRSSSQSRELVTIKHPEASHDGRSHHNRHIGRNC